MTLQPAVAPSESPLPRGENTAANWLVKWDALAAVPTSQPVPLWANRSVLVGLFLFAFAVPHSLMSFSPKKLIHLEFIAADAKQKVTHVGRANMRARRSDRRAVAAFPAIRGAVA